MQIARARAARRARLREGNHHMPLPLRLIGLLISIALTLTACDRLIGLFSSDRWNMIGLVLLALVVGIFIFQRMRR
jgi:heme/copper-type cytochrome/quinol oxidase subunit 4